MKFIARIVWGSSTQLEIEASNAREAEAKVRAKALLWLQTVDGDDARYRIDIDPIKEYRKEGKE